VIKIPEKKHFEEVFNKLLGMDIRWSKLPKEDLIVLATFFSNPELLVSKLGATFQKEAARKRLIEVGLEALDEVASQWKGPLAQLVRKIAGRKD